MILSKYFLATYGFIYTSKWSANHADSNGVLGYWFGDSFFPLFSAYATHLANSVLAAVHYLIMAFAISSVNVPSAGYAGAGDAALAGDTAFYGVETGAP